MRSRAERGPLEIVALEAFAVCFPYDVLDAPRRDAPPAPYQVADGRGTLYPTQVETLMVRLESADGTVGWGEALVPVGHRGVQALVEDLLVPGVVGQDASDLGALHGRMVALMRERGHVYGHQADAVTAVDIALYDLVGRHHGIPVATLLGGAVRWQIPTYWSGPNGGPDNVAAARERWDQGWRRFKVHSMQGWRADSAAVARIREALPDAEVALDVHGTYRVADAVRAGTVLDAVDCWFLESALAPEDFHGAARVSASISTPFAAGEAMRHRSEVLMAIRMDAFDVLQPDIGRTGLTEGRAITTLAETAGLAVLPHHSVALGIAFVAGLHLAAATPALDAFEFPERAVQLSAVVLAEPLRWEPGVVDCPDGPGLGITIDEDAVRHWSSTSAAATGTRN